MTKSEIQEKMDEIYRTAKEVYGTCRDGSFEAALHYSGYYDLKKQLEEIDEKSTN